MCIIMEIGYGEKAKQLFMEGYNCSQAVLGAFCDECGMVKNSFR